MVRFSLTTGAVLAGVCLFAACGGEPEAPAPEAQVPLFKPIDPSQAGGLFNVPGAHRYAGVLPCTDCAGIRTELMLLQDPATGEPQIYELKETYLGSMSNDGEKTVTTRGKWTIAASTSGEPGMTVYRLDGGDKADGARSFERVSEQELRLLGPEGRRASGATASLMRVPDVPVLAFPAPSSTTPGSAPPPAPAPGVAQPAAMVTDLAAGWPINLRIGQEMTARLTADRAAGERWSLRAGSDGGVMAAVGAVAYEPKESGAGIEVHRFKAVKPGSITLTFDLKKGSGAAAIRSVSYPVTVQ